jgi:pyrroloquinoline quinone (PQQ) biosynthesis protein C
MRFALGRRTGFIALSRQRTGLDRSRTSPWAPSPASENWIGPFAYIAVGTESSIPPTYRLLVPALSEHYGFSDRDMEFLYEHMTVDDRHGQEGAQLIASVATTEEAQRQALEGARRGGNGWWQILLKHAGSTPVPA